MPPWPEPRPRPEPAPAGTEPFLPEQALKEAKIAVESASLVSSGAARPVKNPRAWLDHEKFVTWRCSSITPLGVPVEPEV